MGRPAAAEGGAGLNAAGRIVVLVGLQAEARLAASLGWPVLVGGGSAAAAEAAARAAMASGATALISFGLAGGLDPALPPGTVLVPDSVLTADRRILADLALSRRLGGPTPHSLFAAECVVAGAAGKRDLFARTGAAAVDLESGAVARVAAEAGLPFAVLRVVCDPAWRGLPPAALLALDAGGRIGLARVLRSILAEPRQIPALLALARDAAAARRSLRRRIAAIAARQPAAGGGASRESSWTAD